MGQQVLSGFRLQDNYSRDLVSHSDLTVRAIAEAGSTRRPIIRVELAALGNAPG